MENKTSNNTGNKGNAVSRIVSNRLLKELNEAILNEKEIQSLQAQKVKIYSLASP